MQELKKVQTVYVNVDIFLQKLRDGSNSIKVWADFSNNQHLLVLLHLSNVCFVYVQSSLCLPV